jgi:hypothetical protein
MSSVSNSDMSMGMKVSQAFFGFILLFQANSLFAQVQSPESSEYYFEIILPTQESRDSDFPNLQSFKSEISRQTSVDTIFLAHRQMEFFREMPDALLTYQQILDENLGRIRDLNSDEKNLFELHLKRNDPESEFCAIFLSKKNKRIALIESKGLRGQASCTQVLSRAKALQAQKWKLESQIHNHPFLFSNPHGDIAGVIFPSDVDVRSHLRWKNEMGLKTALISNGFFTFEYKIGEIKSPLH